MTNGQVPSTQDPIIPGAALVTTRIFSPTNPFVSLIPTTANPVAILPNKPDNRVGFALSPTKGTNAARATRGNVTSYERSCWSSGGPPRSRVDYCDIVCGRLSQLGHSSGERQSIALCEVGGHLWLRFLATAAQGDEQD